MHREGAESLVYKDVGLSTLLGPLSYLVQLPAYFVLYRVIVHTSGLAVLGLWSLLATVVGYMTLGDVGFSQALTREAGHNASPERIALLRKDHVAARRIYTAAGLALTALSVPLGLLLFPLLGKTYSAIGLTVAAALLVVAGVVLLIGKLDAAILAARSENFFLQLTQALVPMFSLGPSLLGAYWGRPIEGYALGATLAAVAQLGLFRWRLSARHVAWTSAPTDLAWSDTLGCVRRLVSRAAHLYSMSIGYVVREPLFRLVLSWVVGLAGVGLYDVAMRVTKTARELVASGFTVLYPALAHLHADGKRSELVKLIRLTELVLVSAGGIALGGIIVFADVILHLWLGVQNTALSSATRILAVWNLITILNVPFWFLLQAAHEERAAARAIWAHTISSLGLVPLAVALPIDLAAALVYWSLTAVITQGMIYRSVERRLGLFWETVATFRLLVALGALSSFVVLAMAIRMSGAHPAGIGTRETLAGIGVVVLFGLIAGAAAIGPALEFVRLVGRRPAESLP